MRASTDQIPRLALRLACRVAPLAAATLSIASGVLAPGASAYTAYVGNYGAGTVTPINTATNSAGAPIAVGLQPFAIAITPDGRTAYVANHGSGTVTPIKTATNSAASPIVVGTNPSGIAITPNGRTAYVANYGSGTVTPVNTATNSAGSPITVGSKPWGIAITPDGKTAYVANSGSGTVTPINIATNAAGAPIAVFAPIAIAITPDGKTAYVAGNSGSVTPIDTATNTARSPIATGAGYQWGIAITPDGRTSYLGNYSSSTLIAIEVATSLARTAAATGAGPAGIAITPDGGTAYVSNSSGNSISPVSLANGTVGSAIGVGSTPYPVAITPDEAPLASFTVAAGRAGSASSFDASASTVAYGPITSYAWNFGDGQSVTTATPFTTHIYAAPGNYTATLTETDAAGTSTTQVFTGQTVSLNGAASAQTARSVSVPAASAAARAAPVAPVVLIALRSLSITRNGDVLVRISCPATALSGCRGTITLSLAKPRARRASAFAARCARGCRSLGSTNYEARAGQRVRVRVHMASFGRKLLARRKALRVTVTATTVSGGYTATTVRAIALRARRP